MLAPLAETSAPGPFVEIGVESLRRYPAFVSELAADADIDPLLSGPGMMRIALTEADEEQLCRAYSWQQEIGLPLVRTSGRDARRREQALTPDIRAAVISPAERHVTPRLLHEALRRACLRQDVSLQQAAVQDFEVNVDRVCGVRTDAGTTPCRKLVIAAGAWSGLLADVLGIPCPVTPIKGQILALRPRAPLPFSHTIYAPGGYLVPRRDGIVVVGATEERAGFETATTADGIRSLLQMAIALIPALAEAPLDSVWTGLRPVSRDSLPLLGGVDGWNNVALATGHGRNGILLTPITADLMADHLLNGVALPPEFSPARFGSKAAPGEPA
jgi:glycine oxidase